MLDRFDSPLFFLQAAARSKSASIEMKEEHDNR